ncbi:MAG: mycoredoxin-dependent peroxiredoxin [Frankiaceae bacterium]|nr:mycoredoxin-dependent peroxiredoxin [Frankiaceae bacterium]
MTGPAIGDQAPDFELRDQHAQVHRLSDYRDRSNVLLVFYPFAFTNVCTGELAALREGVGDVQVLAVSCDSVGALRAFADREGLTYPLLSDFWPHGAVASAYGVFNDALGAADRGSFLIDRRGVVRWTVRTELGQPRDVAAYEKAIAEL